MMGSTRRAQVTEQITGAVQKAGGLLMVALLASVAALVLAAVAVVLAGRGRVPRAA